MTTAKNPAQKRYIARFIPTMAVYVAATCPEGAVQR